MKQLILLILIIILSSCDYNIKSDKEINDYKYQVQEATIQLEEQTAKMQEFELFMRASILRDSLTLVRYKDSITFMKLTKIMCYQSSPHRHSCDTFN